MSKQDLEAYYKRTGLGPYKNKPQAAGEPTVAKKRQPGETAAGEMNNTERRFYDQLLWSRIAGKEITKVHYEEEKFKLGHRCHYTPDFSVVWADSCRPKTYIEVKGAFVREKSVFKFKTSARQFDEYRWQFWQWESGSGWRLVHDLGNRSGGDLFGP